MTSNIGASTISKGQSLGFGEPVSEGGLDYGDMKSRVTGELKRIFRPEFLNRVDEVIVFHKLTREQIKGIIELLLSRLRDQLSTRGVNLELTEEAKEFLAVEGFDPTMGARPLRRAIQRYVEDVLADDILSGQVPAGTTLVMDKEGDHLVIADRLQEQREEVLVVGESK